MSLPPAPRLALLLAAVVEFALVAGVAAPGLETGEVGEAALAPEALVVAAGDPAAPVDVVELVLELELELELVLLLPQAAKRLAMTGAVRPSAAPRRSTSRRL